MTIAGTNLASLAITGGTAGTGSYATIAGICIDNLWEYAYCSINWSQSTTTTASVSLPQSTLTVGNGAIFLSSGWAVVPTTANGNQLVQYTGVSGNTLTGCTGGTGTTSGTIYQAPSVAQIKLSNMSLTSGLQWGVLPLAASSSLAAIEYDATGLQIVLLGTGNAIWSIPLSGQGGTAGTAVTLNGGSAISGITYISTSAFIGDPVKGIIYFAATSISTLGGFYLHDPSGVNPDFTPAKHACSAWTGAGVNPFLTTGFAITHNMSVPPMERAAIPLSNSGQVGVYYWRGDTYNVIVLADDQGAAQSTGTSFNTASFTGTVLPTPKGLVYDATDTVYVFPATLTSLAYSINGAGVMTAMNSGSAMTHTSTSMVGNPRFIPSNGYSGTLPQLFYADSNAVHICA